MNALSRLQEIARSVFENEHIVLGRETTAADIAEWDSVSHISLVLAVEAEFDMRFGTAEIGSLENVGVCTAVRKPSSGAPAFVPARAA